MSGLVCRHDPCLHFPVRVFFMSGTSFYGEDIRVPQSEAQLRHPPSYVDDQHSWILEVSRTDEPQLPDDPDESLLLELRARWFCRNCGSSFSRTRSSSHHGFARDEDGARAFALELLRALLTECLDAPVHPGCSEVQTVKEVMES